MKSILALALFVISTSHAQVDKHQEILNTGEGELKQEILELCNSKKVDPKLTQEEWKTFVETCFAKYITAESPLTKLTQIQVGAICPKYSTLTAQQKLDFVKKIPDIYSLIEFNLPLTDVKVQQLYKFHFTQIPPRGKPTNPETTIDHSAKYRSLWQEGQYGIVGDALQYLRMHEARFFDPAIRGQYKNQNLTDMLTLHVDRHVSAKRREDIKSNTIKKFQQTFPVCF